MHDHETVLLEKTIPGAAWEAMKTHARIAPDPNQLSDNCRTRCLRWRIVIYVMAITYREPPGSEDKNNKKGWGRGVTKRKVD
jgi:hypothetical protein